MLRLYIICLQKRGKKVDIHSKFVNLLSLKKKRTILVSHAAHLHNSAKAMTYLYSPTD